MLFNRIKTRREAIENAKAFILTQYTREELRGEIFPGNRNSDFTEAINGLIVDAFGLRRDIESRTERKIRAKHALFLDKLYNIATLSYMEIYDRSERIVSAAVAQIAREVA